ncbi:MAG TPA: UDP pyrophosphate phosphatase, partial [Marinobacter sp.]|nr:UDP pyrophosphate phosphatase [Marinobacter sp.]
MIGGINSGANQPYQSGSGVVRERSDVARAPAASPDKQN